MRQRGQALAQRVDNGGDEDGRRGDGAGIGGALESERIVLGRNIVLRRGEVGKIAGAWQRIVHERAGQELAVAGIVHDPLEQRLAGAGGDAAVNLAVDDGRIDDGAEIVDRDVARDTHRARVRFDLDFGDVATIGVGSAAGV